MRLGPLRQLSSIALIAAGVLILSACRNAGAGSAAPSTGASAAPSSGGGMLELTVAHTSAGDALAGPNGMTLYIRTSDTGGNSSCTAGCATTWPPLMGDGSQVHAGTGISGTFGTTTRDDGSKQVTHNNQPLYYYSGDKAAGDAKGDGIGGVWHVAPVGASSSSQAPAASATPYQAPGY